MHSTYLVIVVLVPLFTLSSPISYVISRVANQDGKIKPTHIYLYVYKLKYYLAELKKKVATNT